MRLTFVFLSVLLVSFLSFSFLGCDTANEMMDDIVDDGVQPPDAIVEPILDSVMQGATFGTLDHQETIRGVAFSPDGLTLASLGENYLKVWDLHTEQAKHTIPIPPGHEYIAINMIGGGSLFLFREFAGGLSVDKWEEEDPTLQFLQSVAPIGNRIFMRSVGLGLVEGKLAIGSSDQTVRIWKNLAENQGDPQFTLRPGGQVWAVAFSPDERILAGGGGFEGVHLWDVGTGEPIGVLKADTAQVEGLAFSPDGQMLAVATGRGDGEAIHLWDIATQQLITTLKAEGYTVRKVAFSPDGQTIAGGAYYPVGPGVLLWKLK